TCIQLMLPSSVTSGPISHRSGTRQSSPNVSDSTLTNTATGLSPQAGGPGTTITVTGIGFANPVSGHIGTTALTNVQLVSPTQVKIGRASCRDREQISLPIIVLTSMTHPNTT